MSYRRFVYQVATALAVTGMVVSISLVEATAQTILKNGQEVTGLVRTNSRTYRFTNQSVTGSPVQSAAGDEYTFTARQGDQIEVGVDVVSGSKLQPILVLISARSGRQVAFSTKDTLSYKVPLAGEYRLLVLARNKTVGRYVVAVSGITGTTASQPTNPSTSNPAASDPRRQKLQRDYGLTTLDACPATTSNLVVVTFNEYGQVYTYCANPTRLVKAGEYVYDIANDELKPRTVAQTPGTSTTNPSASDPRRQTLQRDYGLTVLNACPGTTSNLVVVTFNEYGQVYTYCANPNRFVKAGEYIYDIASNELKPATVGQTPGTSTPNASTTDPRRQLLQTEFGLSVLDTCPQVKTSSVVVYFQENSQVYTYCATPNRVFPAGEYAYNPNTRNLQSTKREEQCTVSLGGVCIVK
ncbi:MAG TPA: hypothetical protein IGS53_07505 [Leptolyngbyaceae cyanobacterium M33_DOE_097]|uniref:Uncharacterized protein n=1 Tax=Oscillatoriales cyanobacterium SpSt-418 TaxID=2282169 RepID=A0A7C3PTG0_9CYAN|nr:hypothetical protein [Leptolyngbyaceae cyanobacterium M33_DOE_097]